MYLVSIGTPQRGVEFCQKTGFSTERLLADPDNAAYDVLGFKKGVKETFFDYNTPLSMWERIKTGNTQDIKDVMNVWTKGPLWVPPKQDQAFQQGGVVIYKGKELVWSHYDPATSSHADFNEVIKVAVANK